MYMMVFRAQRIVWSYGLVAETGSQYGITGARLAKDGAWYGAACKAWSAMKFTCMEGKTNLTVNTRIYLVREALKAEMPHMLENRDNRDNREDRHDAG
jgi:hypothetical protein